jgi:hypothetical protein
MKNKWIYYGLGGLLLYKLLSPAKASAAALPTGQPYAPTASELAQAAVVQKYWRAIYGTQWQVTVGQNAQGQATAVAYLFGTVIQMETLEAAYKKATTWANQGPLLGCCGQ